MFIVRGLTVLLAGLSGQCWAAPVLRRSQAVDPKPTLPNNKIEVTGGWELDLEDVSPSMPGRVWTRPDTSRSLSEGYQLNQERYGGILAIRDQQCDDSVPLACSRDGDYTEILCSGCSTCCSGEGRCCGQGMWCCTTSDGFPSCCPIEEDNSSDS